MRLFLFLILILFLRIQISFFEFLHFIDKPVRVLNVKVINQYKKKNYYVLKLKNREVTFYTINRDNLKNLLNENVSIKIFTKNISFLDYLKGFFAISFDLKLQDASKLEKYIENQHKDKNIANLFKALFLGESIDYKTRQKLSTLGISHLVALSGFHLGIVSGALFFIFLFMYKFFHKYFPYRNRFFDIGVLVFVVEFIYLYITSFPPSLIRAFIMEIVLFLFAVRLQNIFDIKILIYTFLISFLIFFEKIFSIGFFLSIIGVYYIMLYFKYFKVNFLNSFLMSFFIFLWMFVISHIFFGNFNIYQLFSPFVTLFFTIFYPFEIFLHIIGIGGVFDNLIENYLNLGSNFYVYKVPILFGALFLIMSFIAYYKKWAFYGINLLALIILGGAVV